MMKSLLRGVPLLAILLCAVLFASCTWMLYYPPVDENSPEDIFDAHVAASLLKDKTFKFEDEEGIITIEFSEYRRPSWAKQDKKSKTKYETCILRGMVKSLVKTSAIEDEDEDEAAAAALFSGTVPVQLVPFRQANALFFMITVDNDYIIEKNHLAPIYSFMSHPQPFLVKAEWKDGGWEVAGVSFPVRNVQTDKNETVVLNSPEEILKLLNDPNKYEVARKEEFLSRMLFKPVKSGK